MPLPAHTRLELQASAPHHHGAFGEIGPVGHQRHGIVGRRLRVLGPKGRREQRRHHQGNQEPGRHEALRRPAVAGRLCSCARSYGRI